MDPTAQAPRDSAHPVAKPAGKLRRDRLVKVAFVVVSLVVVALVYFKQRGGTGLRDWGTDLPAALSQAAAENRPVLVFFTGKAISEEARRLIANTIPKNAQAIEEGKFIKVVVKLDSSLDSETAKRYKITSLPTMLVLAPDGAEKNRRVGFIGEMDFRSGFLDCTRILGPEQ